MTTLLDDGFEGTIPPTWFDATTGTGMVDETSVVKNGAHSVYYNTTGTASYNNHSSAVGRVIVGRFYLRVATAASGTATIISCPNTSGNLQLSMRTGPALRAEVGATFGTNSSTLTIGQWYLIDFKFDSSGATATAVFKIDGTDAPSASVAQTAADMTSFRVGNTGTNTYQAYVDDLKVTDTSGDYPLGAPVFGPTWTTPADAASMSTTPELKFNSPVSASAQHFWLELDTANTFNTGNLRTYRSDTDQTNWHYWDGDSWEAIPATGLPTGMSGNEIRYTVTSALSGATWYRRVRAGTLA